MFSMNTLFFLLFVTAIFYFLSCPTVHSFGENIKHDVVLKIEEAEKKTKKISDLNYSKVSQKNFSNLLHPTKKIKKYSIPLIQLFTLNLSILSTIRLIL